MNDEDLEPAARVIRRSALVRSIGAVDEAIRTAATRSRVVAAGRRLRQHVEDTTGIDRVRLAGVVVLTAAIAHDLLLPLVSMAARPVAPHVIHLQTIALAIVMIAGAPALARAWPRSRLRRWVMRGLRD